MEWEKLNTGFSRGKSRNVLNKPRQSNRVISQWTLKKMIKHNYIVAPLILNDQHTQSSSKKPTAWRGVPIKPQ